jgi:hypothetical protein
MNFSDFIVQVTEHRKLNKTDLQQQGFIFICKYTVNLILVTNLSKVVSCDTANKTFLA